MRGISNAAGRLGSIWEATGPDFDAVSWLLGFYASRAVAAEIAIRLGI